jgi:hypothetical protein
MEFNQRLQRAIQRGERTRDLRGREAAEREMSAEEIKGLHSRYRLLLTERIEDCLRKLADNFPGFSYQPFMSESGWGARISRDDLNVERGRGSSYYSRFEVFVSPLGTAPIIELVAKGTIRNKEAFHRRNFQQLTEADIDSFQELIDIWVLDYAELYASGQ